jgi:arylsulfatase A-like enzyme
LATAASACAFSGGADPAPDTVAPPLPVERAVPAVGAAPVRPNIVFITTDDQRLDDLRWMPYTRHLLGDHGIEFTQAISPHPMCCPARASLITGQYAQNNGVHHNEGTHGGYAALEHPADTLGPWLHDAGYQTAMVGKYLNGYAPDRASQQGWDHWNPSIAGIYSYDDTTFYNDGSPVLQHRQVDDTIVDYTTDYIREFARRDAPFFVWASQLAPHLRATATGWTDPLPSPRHRGSLSDTVSPASRKPSYDVRIVDGPKPLLGTRRQVHRELDSLFHARIEALQSVDDGVRKIVRTLRQTGELQHTYIVFTSDNGFLLGEHRLFEKNLVLKEALRVPLLVRVPQPSGPATSRVPVTSVDFAPTFLDLADARAGRRMDGTSFAPLLRGEPVRWRDTQLVQTGRIAYTENDQGWWVRGVRTHRWTFGRNIRTHQLQLYDRRTDPFELVNLADRPGYRSVVHELRQRLLDLNDCTGAGCRRSYGPANRGR